MLLIDFASFKQAELSFSEYQMSQVLLSFRSIFVYFVIHKLIVNDLRFFIVKFAKKEVALAHFQRISTI